MKFSILIGITLALLILLAGLIISILPKSIVRIVASIVGFLIALESIFVGMGEFYQYPIIPSSATFLPIFISYISSLAIIAWVFIKKNDFISYLAFIAIFFAFGGLLLSCF